MGWSEVPRYSFKVPEGWQETPVSIADLGGTEVSKQHTRLAAWQRDVRAKLRIGVDRLGWSGS